MLSHIQLKGILYGCGAAICYGTNPLGALFLYRDGLSPETVLCYRFATAVFLLFLLMLANRMSFKVERRAVPVLAVLGFLFAVCALALYASFNYMDAGLASTLLFLYPLEVALIMGLFFKEKLNLTTALSIAISLGGIALLYRGGEGGSVLNTTGFMLVLASSFAYAIYIVIVSKSRLNIGAVKLSFYAMIFCLIFLLLYSVSFGNGVPPVLTSASQWGWALMLGFVPTVLSLVFMAKAGKLVGSTPTAIMGALEPLTAVVIGTMVFDESLTMRIVLGIVLILSSVVLLALKKK